MEGERQAGTRERAWITYGEVGGRGRGAAEPYDRIARTEGEGDRAEGKRDRGRLVERRRFTQRLGFVEGVGGAGQGGKKEGVSQSTHIGASKKSPIFSFPPSLPPSPRAGWILTIGWDQVGKETVPYRPAGLPIWR